MRLRLPKIVGMTEWRKVFGGEEMCIQAKKTFTAEVIRFEENANKVAKEFGYTKFNSIEELIAAVDVVDIVMFDVEAVFIFPWAINLEALGVSALISMIVFILVLALGLVYAWRKGVLRWA